MPRVARNFVADICYHVLNRGNGGATVFHKDTDYRSFLTQMARACERIEMRVLAYCLMPNHFHFVLWPHGDRDLSRWMQWLMTSHVRRHHLVHGTHGHIWQNRFKAFPVQEDRHLLTVMRYVERNPLRANLVERAEDWPWSSLSRRGEANPPGMIGSPPMDLPVDWRSFVDRAQTSAELEALRRSANRGVPFGAESWVREVAVRLGLESTLRPVGRPARDRTG